MNQSNSEDMIIDKRYYIFLMCFLGALSAFGPFITDFYLPTLPAMSEVFCTTTSMVQLGLTTSMLGLAIGQIFFGPISDKYGRRPVLIVSLVIFCISALASVFSPNIEFFNLCRFFQGLGGSGGIVMSRSIATDCYSGRELAKTLAIVGAINGIAPVFAPVMGGVIAESVGWQGIFCILLVIGILLLFMCGLFRESLTEDMRFKGSLLRIFTSFYRLLKKPRFSVYIAVFGFSYGVLFTYISSASFIVQNLFGYSEVVFSIIFAINAIAIAIGTTLTVKFKNMTTAALFSTAGMTVCSVAMLVIGIFMESFLIYELLTFTMLFFLGFIIPSVSTLVMNEGRSAVGAASALLGAVGFLSGGIVSPLVGIGNLILTTNILLSVCALAGLIMAIIARGMRAQ